MPSYKEILAAILEGRPLIYTDRVLAHQRDGRLPAPPTVKSRTEEYPAEDPEVSACLTLAEFEMLSLAARARLLRLPEEPRVCGGSPHWSSHFMDMQEIDADALSRAITKAARKRAGKRTSGVHIIGAVIKGDLDLANAQLPFSIRLIGCVIEGALRIGRASLATLDLSGSALRGIHGTFLTARGSLRMRRLTSTSVIDLGGLKVADVFDASDMLVFPYDEAPPTESVVGDRGIVNLSLASLSNEMRMFRVRIYGGLTMKGCQIKRSMFLDDAILRAPVAYLERVSADVAFRSGKFSELPLAVRTAARAERKLAKELHGNAKQENLSAAERRERELRCRFEALEEFDLSAKLRSDKQTKLIRRLLAESSRARTSCFRADGLDVKGSVFARSIRSSGRVRCKYAKISGSFHLHGARMRSARDIADGIQAVRLVLSQGANRSEKTLFVEPLWMILRETHDHAKKLEPIADDDFAFDIRESTVLGHLHLTPDDRRGEDHEFDAELRSNVNCYLKGLGAHLRNDWEKSDGHKHNVYVNGQIAMEGAVIGGDFELNGILANLHNVKRRLRPRVNKPGDAFLLMEQVTVRGEVDLSDSIGVHGIEAQHATISSRIRFARHSVRRNTLRRRALLLGGRFIFADSRIGGDATFLFHPEKGPWLMLARSQIEGRLHILPAEAEGVEGGEEDRRTFKRRKLGGEVARKAERDQASDERQALNSDSGDDDRPDEWKRESSVDAAHAACFGDEVIAVNDEEFRHFPAIDLRSARAAEFGQPEAAWPRENHLQIEGFVYQQSAPYGPLAPRARKPQEVDRANERTFWWMLGGGIALYLALVVSLAFFSPLRGWFGAENVLILAGVCGTFAVQHFISRHSRPNRTDGVPRAIYWLGLQTAMLSVYQRHGQTIPLQPYVQAGQVLRSTGQILAANQVERDRLRRRHQQLSWRNNSLTRALLLLADAMTKYGFDPIRTIGLAVFMAAAAACVFYFADREGHVRPISGDLLQVAAGDAATAASAEELVFSSTSPDGPYRPGPAARTMSYPAFSALPYAMDVMVPGLDIGQEEYWRPMGTRARLPQNAEALSDTPEAHDRSWWWWVFAASPVLLKILGWILTTAIAISVLTRIEAMIARHEE